MQNAAMTPVVQVTAREFKARPSARDGHTSATYVALGVYVLLLLFALHFHEPWADEAQSWLLARDASLSHLWGSLLHYEGTPGLWQTLIHVLIQFGLPYSAYGLISATLAAAAMYLLLGYAPLPIWIRVILPFTYFFCYQYAVVARSYALMAPLLFAIAAIYPRARERTALMTALLILLAGVSVHGFLISGCIWLVVFGPALLTGDRSARKRALIGGIVYSIILVCFLMAAWPAKNVAFAEHRGLANLRFLPDVTRAGLSSAFAGYWIPTLAILVFSAPFLWRGGGWLIFLGSAASLCLFGAVVYAQLWHFGIIFLIWIFAMWISAYKTRVTVPALAALLAASAFQCYWTGKAIWYDWQHAYSGSQAAARFLRQSGIASQSLYAVGYPTTAVQPYFPANIYSNFPNAYWDWSHRNRADDPAALLESQRNNFVLIGYKNFYEKQRWAGLLDVLGYRMLRQFEGGTFWETGVFESESYDIYKRVSAPRVDSPILESGDPAVAPLFLRGFYGIEGKWRWTARDFSVLLKAGDGSPAGLDIEFFIPDMQLQKLGPITIRGSIAGHELAPRTFSRAGSQRYWAPVAAEALRAPFVTAEFQLDKSSEGRYADARDLGIVVTRIGLSGQSSPAR
jgi:hypothetical protein